MSDQILQDKYEELGQAHVKAMEEIASLKEQLKREQDCTDWYADYSSWEMPNDDSLSEETNIQIAKEDHECFIYSKKNFIFILYTGGKLARSTQARREK